MSTRHPLASRAATARALLVCASAGAAGCQDSALPHLDLERMIIQARYEVYEASPLFEDQRVMRTPPEGTVPTDRPVGSSELLRGVGANGYVDTIPVPRTRALLERGRERFDVHCAACHGLLGDGESRVALKMTLRKPPSLVGERGRSLPPGRIFEVASEGYGLMRSYAADLPDPADRWAVVAYVRALQIRAGVALSDLPPPLAAKAREALR